MTTKQEIFDQVAIHLLKQYAKAEMQDDDTGDTLCVYRAPDGLKCAVGCLITDEEYRSYMEYKNVDQLIIMGLLPSRLMEHRDLLVDLQQVHDQYEPNDWSDRLRCVAEQHGLKMDILY